MNVCPRPPPSPPTKIPLSYKTNPPVPKKQLFSGLVDNCFVSCVDDFTSKALSGRENGCLSRCVLKSMTTQTRLGERFAELNQAMTAEQQMKH